VKLTASPGWIASESSIRSPNSLSPSSPSGVCGEIGLPGVLLHLGELLRGHVQPGRELGMGKGRNGADPFVIALAVARDGVVVTEEYTGTLASPEIPVVCEALAVRCMTTVEFVQDQGWTF